MGKQFVYKCNECNFEIVTNEEGSNSVMRGFTRLYKCLNCSELINHFISLESVNKDISRLNEIPTECPKCVALLSLKRWNPSLGCPKCGDELKHDPYSIIMTD